MNGRLPLLVRAFLLQDRLLSALLRGAAMIRDETLWAWISPRLQEEVNRLIYARRSTFAPGGSAFEKGLFDWERAATGAPPFPASGRILLGGAGGGRELAELCRIGYEVVAFEPAPALAEAAQSVVRSYPASRVICASYRDLVRSVEDGTGPLAPHVRGVEFDAVILGWISICHVLSRPERDAVFRSLRALAPRAPVLVSYFLAGEATGGRLPRLRLWFRRLLRLTGAPALAAPGDTFWPDVGFLHRMTADDLRALSEQLGYEAVALKRDPPHALLKPRP